MKTYTIQLIDGRSNRPLPCQPLGIAYSDPDLAKQEAQIAAFAEMFKRGETVKGKVVEVLQ